MTISRSEGPKGRRIKALAMAAATAAMVLGGFMPLAKAQGAMVRYSYEEARVGGEREFVLLPVAEASLRGEVNAQLLEQAFERLRQAKRSTYGNAYASVSGTVPNNARVEVHIPADKARYAPIIIAEAVYTLTEFGVDEVFFPNHTEGGVGRGDIAFSAFSLTIPLWKAVPTANVTSAQVRMPDGELVPASQVAERWRTDREAVIGEVYSYLESEGDYTVRSVLRELDELGDLRIAQVTPLLTHRDGAIRSESLSVLEGMENNETVLEAVVAALEAESNQGLAREMAEFLKSSSAPRFNVHHAFYLVEHGEDAEAAAAAASLAGYKGDERVVELLAELLRDERPEVASAAATSLGELDVHEQRIAALADEKVSEAVRFEIAEALAAINGDASVRLVGLTYLAAKRSEGHANQAIEAMAALPIEAAREQVEVYLEDESRSRRLAAIGALQDRNDVASVKALLSAAESAEEGSEMAQAAYAIMVAQSQENILAQTNASSLPVQTVAYQAIGASAAGGNVSDEIRQKLLQGTRHRSAEIRGASARAFGEIGGAEAVEVLGTLVGDSSAVVRRDVALALGKASSTAQAQTLVSYLDDSDPGVVSAAIDAMEQRQDQQASERIRGMVSHEDPRVRASAIRAVTSFIDRSDETTVRQHMGLLSGAVTDSDPHVQLVTLEQLGRFDDRIAVTNIALQVGAEEPRIRVAALKALAETGHQSARPLLESALGDRVPEVRLAAIEALTKLQGPAARLELEARLEREEDPQVQELLRATIEQY